MFSEEQINNVKDQLNTFYEIMFRDINNAQGIGSIENIYKKEYNKISIMAETVKEELIYDAKITFRSRPTEKDKLDSYLQNMGKIRITPCVIEMNKQTAYMTSQKQSHTTVGSEEKFFTDNMIVGAIAGAVGGVLVGGFIVGIATGPSVAVIGGAAVGAVCGGAAGALIGSFSDSTTKIKKPIDMEEVFTSPAFSTEGYLVEMRRRKQDVTEAILQFIEKHNNVMQTL